VLSERLGPLRQYDCMRHISLSLAAFRRLTGPAGLALRAGPGCAPGRHPWRPTARLSPRLRRLRRRCTARNLRVLPVPLMEKPPCGGFRDQQDSPSGPRPPASALRAGLGALARILARSPGFALIDSRDSGAPNLRILPVPLMEKPPYGGFRDPQDSNLLPAA
jgi:hypothetical protein